MRPATFDSIVSVAFEPAPLMHPERDFSRYNKRRGVVPVMTAHGRRLRHSYPGLRIAPTKRGAAIYVADPVGLYAYWDTSEMMSAWTQADRIRRRDGIEICFDGNDRDIAMQRAQLFVADALVPVAITSLPSYGSETAYKQPVFIAEPDAADLIDFDFGDGNVYENPERTSRIVKMGIACNGACPVAWPDDSIVIDMYPHMTIHEYLRGDGSVEAASISFRDVVFYDAGEFCPSSFKMFPGASGLADAKAWIKANTSLVASLGIEY